MIRHMHPARLCRQLKHPLPFRLVGPDLSRLQPRNRLHCTVQRRVHHVSKTQPVARDLSLLMVDASIIFVISQWPRDGDKATSDTEHANGMARRSRVAHLPPLSGCSQRQRLFHRGDTNGTAMAADDLMA